MEHRLSLEGIHPAPLVAEALKYAHGGTALHLGAASGRNSLVLAANGYRVTAVDSSRSNLEVLAFAAKHANLPVGVLLADTADFKPQTSYDFVLGSAIVHFFDRETIASTIHMMKSVTKPGGLDVLMITAENDGSGDRPKLFESGILAGYYDGWEVLAEEEHLAPAADFAGEHQQFHRAGLVVRRPA